MRRTSLFVISAIASLGLSTPALAQCEDDDPLRQGACQIGKSVGAYIGHKMALEAEILRLRGELARCGSCPGREALELELGSLELQKGAILVIEGTWLRSIGLEYDSFGELFRAMWEEAQRNAERAREEEIERDLMFRLRQPVALWCSLHRAPREAGTCTTGYFTKWANEFGDNPTSPGFARRLHERQRRARNACFNSLLKLRVEANPRPAEATPPPGRRRGDDPGRNAPSPMPPEAETRACEEEISEWARLRNQVDAFCLANGGTRPKLVGGGAERFPHLANDLVVDYRKCGKLVQGRRVEPPARAAVDERAARQPGAAREASREPARSARASVGPEATAIPPGTVLVMTLLTGVDAKTRSGAPIRAALQQPLLLDGAEAAPEGAIFMFRYRIAADRRDRRQLAYMLEPQALQIGARRVPVESVAPARGTPALEGRGEEFLVLPPGTVLTVVVQ
jgi:hypothetical protein